MAVDVETRRTDCGMVSKLRTRNLVLGGVVGESIEKEQQTVQRFAVLIGQQSHDRLQRRLTPLRRNICIRHTHTHTDRHRDHPTRLMSVIVQCTTRRSYATLNDKSRVAETETQLRY